MAFAHAFNMEFTIKRNMEDIMKQNIFVFMLSDSRSLLAFSTKHFCTREKWLMVDKQLKTLTNYLK